MRPSDEVFWLVAYWLVSIPVGMLSGQSFAGAVVFGWLITLGFSFIWLPPLLLLGWAWETYRKRKREE